MSQLPRIISNQENSQVCVASFDEGQNCLRDSALVLKDCCSCVDVFRFGPVQAIYDDGTSCKCHHGELELVNDELPSCSNKYLDGGIDDLKEGNHFHQWIALGSVS